MNETILVVDDEPKIVKQAQDYLEKSGYHVLSAGDGATALASLQAAGFEATTLVIDAGEDQKTPATVNAFPQFPDLVDPPVGCPIDLLNIN